MFPAAELQSVPPSPCLPVSPSVPRPRHFRLRATPRAPASARAELARFLAGARLPLTEQDQDDLELCLGELVANAYRHGSPRGCHDFVLIAFCVVEDEIRLRVHDDGPGFDPASVPEPDLLATSGRGLFLCRRLMDRVDVVFPRYGGCAVTLTKRLPR